jgi:transposase
MALAAHSEGFVEQIKTKFERIKLGIDRKSIASDTFRELQRAADFEKLARERIRKNNKEDQFQFIPFGHPVLNELAAKLMPKWKPRYTSPPFGKWHVRAKAIHPIPENELHSLDGAL